MYVCVCVCSSETPLHAASASGSIHLVAFLLDQPGVDVNVQGADGHTPLHTACLNGNTNCVQLLLNRGADVSRRCSDGNATCFMWAYERGK